MDFIREAPPAFPPGTGHQYSNSAYTVLGAIAQQVSGQPYKDLYEAYGPAATLRGGKWAVGHNGGSQGKSTLVEWYAGEWTAVKLSNYDPQDTMPVDDEIQGILTR